MNADYEREQFRLVDAECRHFSAVWSRSGKRLIVSLYRNVNAPEQIELDHEQVQALSEFLRQRRE